MFKKVSLLAAGASAEYTGTSVAIPLCTAQAETVVAYTASIYCHAATIKLEGGDAPADNELTDGYKATMTVGYTGVLNADTDSMFYGICVIAKAMTTEDATAYQKAPQGMCLGLTTATFTTAVRNVDNAAVDTPVAGGTGLTGGIFCHMTYATLVTAMVKTTAEWTESKIIARSTTQTEVNAQNVASMTPTGCTSMATKTDLGAVTGSPATTGWYTDNTTVDNWYNLAASTAISVSTTDTTATFYMPIEADTYATVPRLSPADTDGW